MLPQASALLPCAGCAGGVRGWRRGSGTLLEPPENLGSALLVDTEANQRSAIVDRPKPCLAVPFYPHGMCSPGAMGQSVCPAPGWLLAVSQFLDSHQLDAQGIA